MKTQRLQEHGGENKDNLPKPVVGVTKRVKEKLEFSSQKEKKRHSRTENNISLKNPSVWVIVRS